MPEKPVERCAHLISPGLLNRCSLYRRNNYPYPDKCWDDPKVDRRCPNNTTRGRKGPFPKEWEEQLARSHERYLAKIRMMGRIPPELDLRPEPEPEDSEEQEA